MRHTTAGGVTGGEPSTGARRTGPGRGGRAAGMSGAGLQLHPLAWVRQEHGWSHQDVVDLLAARVGNMAARREKAWRWENWDVVPDEITQFALADLLEVPKARVKELGWPAWLPAGPKPAIDLPWTVPSCLAVLADTGGAMLDRRGFLTLSVGATAGMSNDWLQATTRLQEVAPMVATAVRGGQLDETVVAALEDRLPALRRMDAALGGHSVRHVADAEMRLVTDLLMEAGCPQRLGQRMFAVAAELGRIAGWASFDAGFEAAAERYWVAAVRAAHLAGDAALGANILKSMSLQAMDAGRQADALTIAAAAHEGVSQAPARIRAMMTLRHARAQAGIGDTSRVERLLIEADGHMEAIDNGQRETPAWAGYFDHAEYAAQVASCYLLLDRHRHSERWLAMSLQEQPDERCRDRATYLMWRAETALNLGDVDRACDVVGAALVDILAARSSRNRARLGRLNARLQQHQTPATRDLNARLGDLLAS